MSNPAGVPAEKIPRHIAIIMDGNGRWARERGLPRIEGHRRGSEAVRACTAACIRAMSRSTVRDMASSTTPQSSQNATTKE